MKYISLLCVSILMLASPAMAADEHADHSGMHHEQTANPASNPANDALMAAHETMMKNMHVSMTGDADVDFVTMMIPHHQGAVDMCKVELQFGTDADIKKLCDDIIVAQEKEIAQMNEWLRAHAKQ